MATIYVNGRPIEDYGVVVGSFEGWLQPPEISYTTVALAGRSSAVPVDEDAAYRPRELPLGFLQTAASVAAQRTSLSSLYRAMQGQLEISCDDNPNKIIYAQFESAEAAVFGIPFSSPKTQALGRLVAYDPFWYDRFPFLRGLKAGERVEVPYGDAPGRLWLYCSDPMGTGTVTNPEFSLRHKNGSLLARQRYTVSLTTVNDWFFVDHEAYEVTKSTAGTFSKQLSTLNAEDGFLRILPSQAPTIEVTSPGVVTLAVQRGWQV